MINCPREDKFDVLLTEMMANTTISEIINEAIGRPDDLFPGDKDIDATRRISVDNVRVSFVKRTNEQERFYKDSVIVVYKNETENAYDNQYSVMRFWQNSFTLWIESEHLFDIQNGPYDDIFVFDNYAVVVDKAKKIVSAVYFDQHRGDLVPR